MIGRLSRVVVVAYLLAIAPLVGAAPSVFIEELTWPELRDAIAAGSTTIIVPVGGTEQNGPHMPDTSLALAVDPKLVRADRTLAKPAGADGVYGDPRRANAGLGQLGVDLIVKQTADAIRAATQRH